jgi:catechol 2,3-dioxygenase-like lactoylglutathione lyase family enzyme
LSVCRRDVVGAVHYYRDTLGLPMLPAGGRHAGPPHFKCGDTFLAVFERGASVVEPATPLVAFEVDDIDAEMAALTARGVVFEGDVRGDGETRWVTFRDPDGNVLELIRFAYPVN